MKEIKIPVEKLKEWFELLSVDGKNTKSQVKKEIESILNEVENNGNN